MKTWTHRQILPYWIAVLWKCEGYGWALSISPKIGPYFLTLDNFDHKLTLSLRRHTDKLDNTGGYFMCKLVWSRSIAHMV